MKRLVIVSLALVSLALAAPSFAVFPGQSKTSVVELINPANGTRIALKAGNELKLMLDADPTNSMQWVSETKVAPVLSPIGQRAFVSKSSNVVDLTAGGWNIFRFKAEKPGNLTLTFEAKRTDQAGPALRTVRYEVTVE